jgi:limonene-1,2-epoxide hydrolase
MMDETASTAAKIAVARAMLAAWDVRNWDQVLALFAQDGVLQSMMAEPIVGRDNLADRLAKLGAMAHTVNLRITHVGVIDDLVFMERVDEITRDGRMSPVPVIGVFDIADGVVREWREYYDRAQLLAAMGAGKDF